LIPSRSTNSCASPATLGHTQVSWFRHFFRHAYGVPLNASELETHLRRLAAAHPKLRAQLGGFLEHLRAGARSLEK
jgi:hypothetical protein